MVAAGGADVVSLLSLQPVTSAPITSPNSTIRVDSLFIVPVTLNESQIVTSKKIPCIYTNFMASENDSWKQGQNINLTVQAENVQVSNRFFWGNHLPGTFDQVTGQFDQFQVVRQIPKTEPRHPALLLAQHLAGAAQL